MSFKIPVQEGSPHLPSTKSWLNYSPCQHQRVVKRKSEAFSGFEKLALEALVGGGGEWTFYQHKCHWQPQNKQCPTRLAPLWGIQSIKREQSSVRFIGWVQTEHLFHPPKAGSPILPFHSDSGQPPSSPVGLQWFIVWGRPCEKLCLFCLLSYQLHSYNGPGVLTILPSGERRLWPGSKLAGETCCKTDWLVTMALLPWWLIVEEEVTSLFPCWL